MRPGGSVPGPSVAMIFVRRVDTVGPCHKRAPVASWAMTHRFTVTGLDPGSRRVEKRGSEQALAREAAALAIVAGASWAPAVVSHEPGLLVSSRVPGAPRALAALGAGEARALGAVLRAVHDTRRAGEGGLWWWTGPAATLAGYRAARVEDAEGALAGTRHAGLAARAAAAGAPPRCAGGPRALPAPARGSRGGQHRVGRLQRRRSSTGSSAAWGIRRRTSRT